MNASNKPIRLPDQTQVSLKQSRCEINKLHAEIISAARTSLDKAIRIGKLLTDARAKLNHGEWLPWLRRNISFTDRTARNYIRCFEERKRLKLETISNLADAYRLLEGPPRHLSLPPYTKSEYTQDEVGGVLEVVEFAAGVIAKRGIEVTPEQCGELFGLLLEKRLRISAAGRGEIFEEGQWRPLPSDAGKGGAE